jgi:trehalose utilization protein
MTIKATIFNEFIHEQRDEAIARLYPRGIHGAIAGCLNEQPDIEAKTATLEEPEHGLGEALLAETDVLVWWGHLAHDKVEDAVVERVHERVLRGMGLIVLHSGHHSKIFKRLMGTSCSLSWREAGERERMWVVSPNHPITQGLDRSIVIPAAETYGEFFDVPDPDELIFVSWFEGGEVFRSGAAWHRGQGRIFYFRPGHETYPIYYQEEVQKVLTNAVRWARFQGNTAVTGIGEAPNIKEPPEPPHK